MDVFFEYWVAQSYGTRCVSSTRDKRDRKKTQSQCRWTPETCRCRWTGDRSAINLPLTIHGCCLQIQTCAIVQHEVSREYARQTWPNENAESVQVNARNLPLPLNRKTDPSYKLAFDHTWLFSSNTELRNRTARGVSGVNATNVPERKRWMSAGERQKLTVDLKWTFSLYSLFEAFSWSGVCPAPWLTECLEEAVFVY